MMGLMARSRLCALWLVSFAGAAAQLPAAPAPRPDAAKAPLAEARRLIEAGDFRSAANLLSGYLKADASSAEAHRLLAYSYLRLDDPKHSLEEYTSAAAIERPGAVDLENVAKDYILLGDTASAEHWARVALGMNQRDPDAWYELGRILYTQQHFQDAVECFQQVLVLLPGSVKAEDNLGLAYEGLNRIDDAVAAYRQAIAWQHRDPHPSEQPLLNLGILLGHQGNLEEAFTLLSQAVAIAPRDPRIREELGHLCLQMKRLDEARQQLQEAVALDPRKASLHFLLGRAYHLQGQESQAKAEFALAASLSEGDPKPERF
jgi:Flp pilus assembly protein TadD